MTNKDTASQSQAVPSELASRDIRREFELWKSNRGESAVYESDNIYQSRAVTAQFEAFMAGAEFGKFLSHSAATGKETDGCKFCLGAKGSVPGNANILGGEVICDYCTALLMKVRDAERVNPTRSLFASPAAPLAGKAEPVAWAVVSPKGGIHKLAIKRDSAERKLAAWLQEWPNNTPSIRPLVYGDAPLAAAVPAEEASDVQRDAARYRYLRNNCNDRSACFEAMFGQSILKTGDNLDASIDGSSDFAPAEPAPIQSSALTARVNEFLVDAEGDPCRATQEAAQLIAQAAELVRELEAARLSKPTAQGAADEHAAWIDKFGNVWPLGAYSPTGKPNYLDADKRGWQPLYRHIAAQAPAGRDAQIEWTPLEQELPEANRVVWVLRQYSSGKKVVYLGKRRNNNPLTRDPDTSRNDWWSGIEPSGCSWSDTSTLAWAPYAPPTASHAAEQASGGANADAAR